MKIKQEYHTIFGSTQISDLFFREYLPDLDPFCVKVYIYCLYLAHVEPAEYTPESLSAALSMERQLVGDCLIKLECAGLLCMREGTIYINDLCRAEIERSYRPRSTGRPDEPLTGPADVRRQKVQVKKAISDRFFSGQMPPSWYNEIDLWFERYGFSPDVMLLLFQHCHSNKVITKPYVRRVAESWNEKNIRTVDQLEAYLKSYEEYKNLRNTVVKRLKWKRSLNVYEEAIVDKWFYQYQYTIDIIDIALKKSVSKSNATLALFDGMITDWYRNGLRTPEEIQHYEEERKKKYAGARGGGIAAQTAVPQKGNFEERKYDEAFLESFYQDDSGGKK